MRRKILGVPLVGILLVSLLAIGTLGAFVFFWKQPIDTVTLSFNGLEMLMVEPSFDGYANKIIVSALDTCNALPMSTLIETDFPHSALLAIEDSNLAVDEPIRFFINASMDPDFEVTAVSYWVTITTKGGLDLIRVYDTTPIVTPVNNNIGDSFHSITYADTIDHFYYITPPVLDTEPMSMEYANGLLVCFGFGRSDGNSGFGDVDFDIVMEIKGSE